LVLLSAFSKSHSLIQTWPRITKVSSHGTACDSPSNSLDIHNPFYKLLRLSQPSGSFESINPPTKAIETSVCANIDLPTSKSKINKRKTN
jgi:hypothetical protein